MKYSNIFWGVILVTLGSLFFLKNLDILYFEWGNILRLWPLLLVLWGISILPTKSIIKVIVSFVIVAVTVIFLITSPNSYSKYNFIHYKCNKGHTLDIEEQHFYEPFNDSIKNAILVFEAAAGKFEVTDETEHLLEFDKRGNIGPYKFLLSDNNKKKEIVIELKNSTKHINNIRNNADIKLNRNVEWDIYLDVGAAKINLDLSKIKTKYLDIDGGASSVRIKLGDKSDYTKLDIDAGVASLYIKIPESSGCEIRTESFLMSKNFSGFDKLKKGVYRTPNFDNTSKKIHINIDAAISSLKVRRY
ncbi:MAG: DUF5668 domain-containing protein [Bacteroidales bacterium]|nr:DUF5668 domain-containing protein [Bacteroidales bacterium]